MEGGIPLGEALKLRISKDVLAGSQLQQLQSLHLGQKFQLFLCACIGGELMHSSVEKEGSGYIGIAFVYVCQFQHELSVFSQK